MRATVTPLPVIFRPLASFLPQTSCAPWVLATV